MLSLEKYFKIIEDMKSTFENNTTTRKKNNRKYPRNKKKLDALPANTNIYLYNGHGKDMCDPITHQPLEAIVPDNCILVTTGLCGRVTYYNEDRINLFREDSEESRRLLRYPYLKENLVELSKRMNEPIENFHIKFPGDKYIVSSFNPVQEWNTPNLFKFAVSGLCEKRDMERLPKGIKAYEILKEIIPKIVRRVEDNFPGILRTVYVGTYLTNLEGTSDKYPYKKKLHSSETFDFFNRIDKNEPFLSPSRLQTLLEEYLYSITFKEFKSFFSASTLPPVSEVRGVVEDLYYDSYREEIQDDTTLNPENIKEIARYLQESEYNVYDIIPNYQEENNNNNKTSEPTISLNTKSIMENLPGIHYFTICRSVDKTCEEGASLRRTTSTVENQDRRASIEKALEVRSNYLPNLETKEGGTRKKTQRKRKGTRSIV